MKKLHLSHIILIISIVSFLSSCLKDPDIDTYISVNSQLIKQNHVFINGVSYPKTAWVTLRKDVGGSPDMTKTISSMIQVNAGRFYNLYLRIDTSAQITDNMSLWAMLHEDTGIKDTFEYSGPGSPDQPSYSDGLMVAQKFQIRAPYLKINNQSFNDTLNIDSIAIGIGGWINIYTENESGGKDELIHSESINGGFYSDEKIIIDDQDLATGTKLIGVLNIDQNVIRSFEPEFDYPEIFGKDTITSSFLIE